MSGSTLSSVFCCIDNVGRGYVEGVSPWHRTHGTDCKGKPNPCGSKLYFKLATERTHTHKFEEPVTTAIFTRYETTLGYGWYGLYSVWTL